MILTAKTHPQIIAAMQFVEEDNGGHLIGTVYPGEPIDMGVMEVPPAFEHLVDRAESGLARLKAEEPELWNEFVCGEQVWAEAIEAHRGDLDHARELIDAWFNGFSTGEEE